MTQLEQACNLFLLLQVWQILIYLVEIDTIALIPEQQMLYSMERQQKPVGLTKDVGWEFGLRKTFPYSQQYVWDFMFSDEGLKIWLGELNQELEIKRSYQTKEGITGLVRVFTPYSHMRINWKKKNWENMSTVQVRVMGNHQKATISFLQEKLLDNNQREEMKLYWNQKMIEIEKALMTNR